MAFRHAFPLVALFFVLGLGLSGCGDGATTSSGKGKVHTVAPGAKPKLAFIINNPSEFWTPARKGLEKFEKESGVHVDFKQPPTGATEEQNAIVEDLISQNYDGFAISPIAPADQTRQINKAAEKMNVICHDSDAAKSNRLAYIGTNNVDAGKALGERLTKVLPNGGKAAVFVGTFAADNAAERLKGLEEGIKGSKIEIVVKLTDDTKKDKAKANVQDTLNGHPEINIYVGLWSYNLPAIISAVGDKPNITVAGFDDEEATLRGIESGKVMCTVVQKPFEFGYQSAKLLYELCTKGDAALPKNPIVDPGFDVIDSTNVKAYEEKLAELRK